MSTPLTQGVLIAFEGIDGAGKTTQANLLARHCHELGYEVVASKEPTNGRWGQQLRNSAEAGRLPPEDELRLFIADRREHVETTITPALRARKIVIVDRYYFSTAAYQGARGMDPLKILEINEEFAPQPDLLLLLTIEPRLGRSRIASRGDRANLFEGERELAACAEIFSQIRRSYLRRLDGHEAIHVLERTISDIVGDLLTRRRMRASSEPTASVSQVERDSSPSLDVIAHPPSDRG